MSDAPLVDRFDALLCDLDGVVYRGDHAISGGPESLERVRSSGTAVVYVTNNASRPPAAVAEQISRLGASAEAGDVVSSAGVAATLLAGRLEPGTPVLVTGAEALALEISAAGLCPVRSQAEDPRAVVQGFDPRIGWEQLAEAAYTLADPGVLWCATNTDRTIPKERGIAPGNGTLVAAVAAATGREPVVAGKPEAAIFEEAARRAEARRPGVIGDRLDTDIRGAYNAGMPGIQVLTGVDTAETALKAPVQERPAYLIGTLHELFESYPDPEVTVRQDGARAVCREAVAVATRETVTIEGGETGLDGWRAACAAWWAVHPRADSPTTPRVHREPER